MSILKTIVCLFMLIAPAMGQERHPPEHQSLHNKFYSGWMRPDNRSISCCSEKDCAPAQSRMSGGHWQARNSDAEEWIDVPASRVETERDSPDGRSHLCKALIMGSVYVYCFLPASGS